MINRQKRTVRWKTYTPPMRGHKNLDNWHQQRATT